MEKQIDPLKHVISRILSIYIGEKAIVCPEEHVAEIEDILHSFAAFNTVITYPIPEYGIELRLGFLPDWYAIDIFNFDLNASHGFLSGYYRQEQFHIELVPNRTESNIQRLYTAVVRNRVSRARISNRYRNLKGLEVLLNDCRETYGHGPNGIFNITYSGRDSADDVEMELTFDGTFYHVNVKGEKYPLGKFGILHKDNVERAMLRKNNDAATIHPFLWKVADMIKEGKKNLDKGRRVFDITQMSFLNGIQDDLTEFMKVAMPASVRPLGTMTRLQYRVDGIELAFVREFGGLILRFSKDNGATWEHFIRVDEKVK